MGAFEDLLLNTLRSLQESVEGVREQQDAMKDQLHKAVLDNTNTVAALDKRVAKVESTMKTLRSDVRKDARRWGAAGGFVTTAVALAVAALKAAFGWKG